ncbi:MAG TPA: TonB-dependent receptor [Chitinophagaceae bacterium]|nr:TonB-dependent receptor [Chitinophagaceae bacterium]
MKKGSSLLIIAALLCTGIFAQENDSSTTLTGITIRSFEQNKKQYSSAAVIKIINAFIADRANKISLVSGMNTIAGLRMEERSPGSYRLNIRGSSLRSPFGVRNIKVYWNGIPVTDPGGNTYFNQFALNNFSTMEVFKGPAGSLYGAGTGGLILMNVLDKREPGMAVEGLVGSYGTFALFGDAEWGKKENPTHISYAHNHSDGYRVQSEMRRDNFSWTSHARITDNDQVTVSFLFTDMYYQTPGALTVTELNANPKAARPAGGGFPSAVAAQAAINQKNILAGFTNEIAIHGSLKNSTTLYGAFAQVRNPAIRNYERRNEPHFGGRSTFSLENKKNNAQWKWVAGAEFQQGYFNTQVAKNKNGNPDTIQTNDDIHYADYSLFAQGDFSWKEKWFAIAGLSFNNTRVAFSRLNVYPVLNQERRYSAAWEPRFSLMRKTNSGFSVIASVAKGFSPPTIAELLPSTGMISTFLDAEQGWNYELTLRQFLFRNKLQIELTGFSFRLNHALVQRRDLSGADYFINAGDIRQKGIEWEAGYMMNPRTPSIINNLIIRAAGAFNHFRYGNFIKTTDDFSGKTVPSVPGNSLSFLADLSFVNGIFLNLTWYSASKIFLNDANTASASAYHLLGCRLGWKNKIAGKYRFTMYAGADNLLNEHYSLGNDINAAGGRYFNAAPLRNYYIGIAFKFLSSQL